MAPGVQARLELMLRGDHNGSWTLNLADKDLGLALALQLDENVGLDLPLATAAAESITPSIEAGYGDKDRASMMAVLREKK